MDAWMDGWMDGWINEWIYGGIGVFLRTLAQASDTSPLVLIIATCHTHQLIRCARNGAQWHTGRAHAVHGVAGWHQALLWKLL